MTDSGRSGGACTRRLKPRKKIRLPESVYCAGELFVLTICTHHRLPLLVPEQFGSLALTAMREAEQKTGATLWCGVVLPDHVHLLVSARPGKSPLDMVSCFKRLTTLEARKRSHSGPLWQRRIHDRGVRISCEQDLRECVEYLTENPVRLGLVSTWDQWSLLHLRHGVFM